MMDFITSVQINTSVLLSSWKLGMFLKSSRRSLYACFWSFSLHFKAFGEGGAQRAN